MSTFKTIFKVVLGALVYFVVQAALGLALPMSPGVSAVPASEQWMTLPGLILVGLVYSAILLYYCRHSSRDTKELAALSAIALFAIGTFQSQIETWYFRKAFAVITDRDLVLLFVQGFVAAAVFAPAAVLLFRGRSGRAVDRSGEERDYSFDRRWWRYLLAALLYLPFYFGFGMLAQLAPVLGTTYAGWTADASLVALLPLWQVLRGGLFAGLAVLVISLFPRRGQAAFALSASFSLFLAIPLVLPSIIMSPSLRLVHFFEIFGSMALYSLTTVALVTKKGPRDSA